VVPDFWVVQTQLFLLTSVVPFGMLFRLWNDLGVVKNNLLVLALVYTYAQAFWFWFAGYRQSDEVVCYTHESSPGNWGLFSQHARRAIVVLYLMGMLALLPLAGYSYVRQKPAVLSYGSQPKRTQSSQRYWLASSGQWFALGIGVFSLFEAIWHVIGYIAAQKRKASPVTGLAASGHGDPDPASRAEQGLLDDAEQDSIEPNSGEAAGTPSLELRALVMRRGRTM